MVKSVFGHKTLKEAMKHGMRLDTFKKPYIFSKRAKLKKLIALARYVKAKRLMPPTGSYEGEMGK